MPRRRRAGKAVAFEVDAERGLALRILLHSPKDTVAAAFAFAAICAIIANALFLQAGRHPSPMFGSVVAIPAAALAPAGPLPRPRPVEADTSAPEPKLAEPKFAEPRPAEPKPVDPLTNLVKATSVVPAASSTIARPPAPIPLSSRNETSANPAPGFRRVAAVQRALTEYGYGQLKPTGTIGSETQAAIQKFERERKIPVTGQMSDRLVRELTAVIGRPIE
jgi:Putative peptidoglycan binding domain